MARIAQIGASRPDNRSEPFDTLTAKEAPFPSGLELVERLRPAAAGLVASIGGLADSSWKQLFGKDRPDRMRQQWSRRSGTAVGAFIRCLGSLSAQSAQSAVKIWEYPLKNLE